jgi:hypothetical protein
VSDETGMPIGPEAFVSDHVYVFPYDERKPRLWCAVVQDSPGTYQTLRTFTNRGAAVSWAQAESGRREREVIGSADAA